MSSATSGFSPTSVSVQTFINYEFTCKENQTVFEGEDENQVILRLDADNLHAVFLNGLVIASNIDYTYITDKLIFTNPALEGSNLRIETFQAFQVAESVSKQYAHDNFTER